MALVDFQRAVDQAAQKYAAQFGLHPQELRVALMTAAEMEGGLGDTAGVGDNGVSVGRFQFNTRGGHGQMLLNQGYSLDQIASDEFQADYWAPILGEALAAAKQQHGNTPEAYRQAIYAVERPAQIYDPNRFYQAFTGHYQPAGAGLEPIKNVTYLNAPAQTGGQAMPMPSGYDPNAKRGKKLKEGQYQYSDGTIRDDAGNVFVPTKADPTGNSGSWVNPKGQPVDAKTGQVLAPQIGDPGAAAPNGDGLGTAAQQISAAVQAYLATRPVFQAGTDPLVYQATLKEWAQGLATLTTAQKNIENAQRGLYEVGGQLIPLESATPEERAAATRATGQAYLTAMNALGLSQHAVDISAFNAGNQAKTQDFQNQTAKVREQNAWDVNNQARYRSEIDRWLEGQKTAAGDQREIGDARKEIAKWGTSGGKTGFSAADLGGAAGVFADTFGIDRAAPLIQFPGYQTWNPVQDRLDSLVGMGVSNTAPPPPPDLRTQFGSIPTPMPLNTNAPAPPQLRQPLPPPGVSAPREGPLPPSVTGQYPPGLLPGEPGYAGGTDMPPQRIPIPRFAEGTGEPVGQSVTGYEIPQAAAQYNATFMGPVLTQRGQDISAQNAALQANAQLQAAYISATQAANQARAQFYIDQGRLGADIAKQNYDQRMGQVTQQLQYAQQTTSAQTARVNARMRALDLLASRSGPQDWPMYNYLLNQMARPTGKLVDPTAFADEIKDPERPAGIDTINQPHAGPTGGDQYIPPMPAAPAAVVNTPPPAARAPAAATYAPPPAPNAPPPTSAPLATVAKQPTNTAPVGSWANPTVATGVGGGYSGVPNAQVAGLTSGQKALVTTGNAGPSRPSEYSNFRVLTNSGEDWDPNTEIPGGTPIWLQRLAIGGHTTAPRFIVGDEPGGMGDSAEMVINPTGAPIRVLSHEQTMQLMRASKAKTAPKYAAGTGGDWSGAPNDFGSNYADAPIAAPPPRTPQQGGGMSGYGGDQSNDGRRPQASGGFAAPMPIPVQQSGGSMTTQPISVQQSGGSMTTQPISVQQANAPMLPPAPAGSGTSGTYGMPSGTGMAFTQYDPATLGAQPFYQKLIGNIPAPAFQGFGATLSNPSLGFYDVPSNLNLQNFMNLNPSEQDMTQGLYSQGLAVDWRDMLTRAKAAYAPMLAGRAGGVAQYGA